MRRGFTLIELMIAVAVAGIVLGIIGTGIQAHRAAAADVVLREKARQVLEHRTAELLAGKPADEGTRAQLLAELPRAEWLETTAGGVRTLTVRWRPARALPERSLVPASLTLSILDGGKP